MSGEVFIPPKDTSGGGGGSHTMLSATHTDSLPASLLRGDLLVANATPKAARLAVGSSGSFLRSDGSDPSWQALVESDIPSLPASKITSGTFADARIAESNVTQHEAAINHDNLLGFVADEHVAHSGVVLTAGDGLTGGGDIAASRTFNFDLSGLTAITVPAAVDEVAIYDSGVGQRKITFGNFEAGLNHDNLAGFVAAEHIDWSVTGTETINVDRIPSLPASRITSGIFGVARGGTGLSTISADKVLYSSGLDTFAEAAITAFGRSLIDDADAAAARTTLGVAIGSDVQAYDAQLADIAGITFSGGDLLYFDGTNLVRLAIGTAGYVLKVSGGLPVWQAEGGGTSHELLSATHTDTVAHTVVLGDVVVGNSTPAWEGLAGNITTTRKFLRQVGTGTVSAVPAWDTFEAGDVPDLDTAKITTGTFADARIAESNVTQYEGAINHDNLLGFVAAEHIDWSVTGAEDVHVDRIPSLPASQITSGTFSVARGGTGLSTISSGKILYTSALDTLAEAAITAFGRSLIDDADAATARSTLGLVIGTDVQGYDAQLADIAGISFSSGDLLYFDGTNIVRLGIGATDQVLKVSGGLPVWAAEAGGSHELLSSTHTDTVAHTVVLGDVIFGNSTPAWAALPGNTTTTRKFLRQLGDGTLSDAPNWDTLVAGDLPTDNRKRAFVWVITDPAVGGVGHIRIPVGCTVTRVHGVTDAGTADFNIEERTAPDTAGTDILSSDLQATTSGADVTSGFAASTLTAGRWLYLDISAVSSATELSVELELEV